MAEKLKPCPFCGAPAHLDYDTKAGMFGPDAGHKPGCFLMDLDFRDYADERHAVTVWNRRSDHSPALLEALKEAQSVLAMMVEPDAIQQTTTLHAYAAAAAAEAKARAAIRQAEGGE